MTRIAIASRIFPPEVSAGAFRLGAVAQSGVRRGHEVVAVTTKPAKHAPMIRDADGVVVRRWPVLRDKGGNVRGYIQYASYDIPLAFRLLFARFDVVIAESPPTTGLVTAVVCWLRRRPLVYYAADVWTDGVISMGAHRAVVSIMRWMERAVLRRASRIISVSDQVTDRLVELGASRERVVTVGNGIDTGQFSPDVVPAVSDEPYFVYTGTMSEWQQPDLFVRAFAVVARDQPGLRLKFFGQGAVKDELMRIADELIPDRVDFGGVVSPTESAGWIRGAVASLVSIRPGIGYDFARPTKTYAAAAVGTPVLFAGPEGGAAVVRDGALGVVAEFTESSVVEAMRTLLADFNGGETERLRAERARWAVDNVSLSAVAERVIIATEDAASSRGRNARRKRSER